MPSNNVTIENTALSLTVAPYLGGRIVSLYAKRYQRDVLMPPTATDAQSICIDKPIIGGGSYPLAPYSNRIKDAAFVWQDRMHTLPISPIAAPHAIHGTACYSAWHVENRQAHSLTLLQHHKANGLWGFDFTLRQHFTIVDNRLTNMLSFTNTDTVHQPIGLGFHPFFTTEGLKTVQVQADGMWQLENGIPLHKKPLPPQYDFNLAKPFVDTVDDLFYGIHSPCVADYGTHKVFIESHSPNAVIFSNAVTQFFCFEPVENVTNAHNMQQSTDIKTTCTYPLNHGLTALAPEDTHSFSMTVTVTDCI